MKIIEPKLDFSSNYVTRASYEIKEIIYHHAAAINCTVEDIHTWHKERGYAGIGYHYFINKKGEIYSGRPINFVGAHTEKHNTNSVGICLEGNFELEYPTEIQLDSLFWIIEKLALEFNISYDNIYPHKYYSATACPGKNMLTITQLEDKLIQRREEKEMKEQTKPSWWAEEACEWAFGIGIIQGDEKGECNWQSPVSMEQLAVILHRYDKFIENN